MTVVDYRDHRADQIMHHRASNARQMASWRPMTNPQFKVWPPCNANITRRLSTLLISAQVRTPALPSKQARTRGLQVGAMTTHNFSPKPLAYDYESDYADSDDYYEYEHMQEVRV